eukprot:8324433-Pyramimonas_sp.AAC.1
MVFHQRFHKDFHPPRGLPGVCADVLGCRRTSCGMVAVGDGSRALVRRGVRAAAGTEVGVGV